MDLVLIVYTSYRIYLPASKPKDEVLNSEAYSIAFRNVYVQYCVLNRTNIYLFVSMKVYPIIIPIDGKIIFDLII